MKKRASFVYTLIVFAVLFAINIEIILNKGVVIMKFSSSKFQWGVSLIESMVAALVISVGLLGLAGMQMIAMKGSSHAFQQGQASDLMQGLLERMRSNVTAVYTDDYSIAHSINYNCTLALTKNCEGGATVCTTKELAKSDLHYTICGHDVAHLGGIRGVLAGGDISISCLKGVGSCNEGINFKVRWNERILGEEGAGQKFLPREISLNTVIVQ